MDISSVVGLLMACGLIIASILIAEGATFSAFIDYPSAMVVIGGAIAASMICFPLKNILKTPGVTLKVFLNKSVDVQAIVTLIVSLAETARRDGLLALEARVGEVDNKFVKLGVQMAVDGTRPEVIEDILQTEIAAVSTRHRDGKAVLDQLGRFAPAYGMIGTLMGLIIMLGNMSDPSSIGSGMAVALITTLYGAIVSNVMALPAAEKLNFISKEEILSMEIAMRGIMAIQAGENPRVIEQKLNTFLPPKARAAAEAA
ncbi:MAG: MotA/TolQ/ExbB proton channel family protein [Planctomycetales bacterium]|nr:MotA/TolQ/ExbB proton channel family protein [Planctomycetales bacterium]